MNCLVLVDIQNDFLPGGALAVPEGDAVIPAANKLQAAFPLVVATQDWHPPNHGSFAVNHPGRKVFEQIDLNGLAQTLWPVHCVQGTRGAELATGLQRDRIARVFQKGTDPGIDSYSGLFDNGHRKATGLGDWLKAKGVTAVYVCGLATDYCVKFTALDAAQLGFQTHLIEDASRGVNLHPDDVKNAIEEMKRSGVKVTTVAEVTAMRELPADAAEHNPGAQNQADYRQGMVDYIRTHARPPHKFSHQPRLYRLAVRLAEGRLFDDDVLCAAAWMHDLGVFIGHRPEDPAALAVWDALAYSLKEVPPVLLRFGFPAGKIPAVLEAIRTHLPATQPTTFEGTLLRDADLLEQLGAIGILRTVSKVGSDTRFRRLGDALPVLRQNAEQLPAQLQLASARRQAEGRLAVLRAFLEAAEVEADGVDW
jgi:nicotinamidase/pyrazinamidase